MNIICGPNANCQVQMTQQDICVCESGYTGDPYSLMNGCTGIYNMSQIPIIFF